jgi:hypothetical protein
MLFAACTRVTRVVRRTLELGACLAVAGVGGAAEAAAAKCERSLEVLAAGKATGNVCADEASERGLTAVDLGDEWTPFALAGAAQAVGHAPPAYAATFVRLAGEKFEAGSLEEEDRALELYGISPNFHVVLARMDDEQRHRCHDAVADEALAAGGVMRWEKRATGDSRDAALGRLRGLVAAAMRRGGHASREALVAAEPRFKKTVGELEQAEARAGTIAGLQAHLVCEGLMSAQSRSRGYFDWTTSEALRAYQRRHWIVATGEVDAETREAMAGDSRELELRLALRVLRQRVADAAGLIEDGSARAEWGTVLGRTLDGPEMRYQGDYPALEHGAPDLISRATEAAAAALGWRDFNSARASLRARLAAEEPRVAIKLPPAPAYHREGAELRAMIDRGEVSYDAPRGKHARRVTNRRPTLIVYAKHGDRETALVRWPTTIGGWQDEKLGNGAVVKKFKASDIGPRVWRDLVVTPVWFAPKSTPDRELVRARNGKWELKQELLGPGYRSAYGLAMLIHHLVTSDGKLHDRAIRTHGSVNYPSISRGDSHGCHRTYNHQILGLTSFLLRHHDYKIKGALEERYVRKVRHKRSSFTARRDDRGFYYELTPPVQVEVLAGENVGKRKKPSKAALYSRR